MDESPPVNAGDTGSSPGLGRSHVLQSHSAREPQLPSLRSGAQEPPVLRATLEGSATRGAPETRAWAPRRQASRRSSRREKAPGQQHRSVLCAFTQPCPTLRPLGLQPAGSSVHGILQARMLERVATSCSRGSSLLRVLHWQAGSLPLAPPRKSQQRPSRVKKSKKGKIILESKRRFNNCETATGAARN